MTQSIQNKQFGTEMVDPLIFLPEGFLEDPYPRLNIMREQHPILFSQQGNQWLVLGFDEGSTILRSDHFGKQMVRWKHPNFIIRQAIRLLQRGKSLYAQDPPDHTRVRSLINTTFSPRTVKALEEHIRIIADDLIQEMTKKAEFDLIADFAFPFPAIVIAELLGVPKKDRMLLKDWSTKISSDSASSKCPMSKMVRSYSALSQFQRYLRTIIGQKRKSPQSDLISQLVEAQCEDYKKLSEDELLANIVFLLIAGHETSTSLISNTVLALMKHPEQYKVVVENPDTISGAIEEVLRFDPPAQIVRRITREKIEVGGETFREGDAVTVLIGACNRDPRVIAEPDSLNILRKDIKHITFGAGIHYCLGAELARVEARIALSRLFQAIPNLRLKPGPIKYKPQFAVRGPEELMMSAGF